jgi:hypothetical protein
MMICWQKLKMVQSPNTLFLYELYTKVVIAIVVQNWYGLLVDPDKRSLHIRIGYLAPEVTPCSGALPDSSGLTTPSDWQESRRLGAVDHVACLDVIVHLENPSQVYKVYLGCGAKTMVGGKEPRSSSRPFFKYSRAPEESF